MYMIDTNIVYMMTGIASEGIFALKRLASQMATNSQAAEIAEAAASYEYTWPGRGA